ncbi:halocyanin-like protein [Halohasta litchfieldiae]|jgi:halocyanin domain|uniref:Halocyanin domain-containing protein n=1 Tax=Halohasta litchfieldiae TaxID=1073996 RepID=A0A1H6RUT6_9EURY|nr:halocyanin domain-containing protein [Halohasta litchfieldiae]ATW89613.1 halocyanin-like protein [Halohasta litchfieldiae]SEI55550.1 halocyanin domain-containing protein [Halohasta litchfieldiae]
MSDNVVSRRGFLRTTAGATAAAGAATATAGTAAAQSEMADFGEVADVDGGTEDLRGESEVTVEVGASGNGGNLAFSPAGIWVDPGTTVTWEWTGEGGDHNVAATDGPAELDSPLQADGTYEFEFTEDLAGITNYQCEPHAGLGMLGAVAVGDDVPTVETGGGGGASGGPPQIPDSAKTLGIATFVAMISTLSFAFFFVKFGGNYDDQ